MRDFAPGGVWPILHYDDSHAARRFLVDVLGFGEVTVVVGEQDEIAHGELRWPTGGSLVFGWTGHHDSVHGGLPTGSNAIYLVTDDVDAIHDRAVAAGAAVANAPHRTAFGSGGEAYAATVRDPAGNLWTVGTYRGLP
jgi:uncharacterized glyoxalase superfamily protein PhnB